MAIKETPIKFAAETPAANPPTPEEPKPADEEKHDSKAEPAPPVKSEATVS